jgi:hypothetical protein
MGPDERVRTALLAGLAGLALVLGAWWWQGAVPTLGAPDPSPGPSRKAFLAPGVRASGPVPGLSLDVATPGPDDSVIRRQAPGATSRGGVAQEVWHQRAHLAPDDRPLVHQAGAGEATQYLLTVRCVGPGEVVVEYSGTGYTLPPRRVRCGEIALIDVWAPAGPLSMRFTAVGGELELDARLSALF